MALTKQMQRIVAREIRPYILPLPNFDDDDPVLIAAFLGDEDWFRWHKHWISCYIPLRTVCNVFRSLHLGELMVANLLLPRRLPDACWPRNRMNRIACKHGAPWVERLNHVGPLLTCTKIAKTSELKSTGARNARGIISGVRNNEWLNGTSHFLFFAFDGSNSDVFLTGCVSAMALPHEDSGKTILIGDTWHSEHSFTDYHHAWARFTLCGQMAQRVHPNINDYFESYSGKAELARHMAMKKRIDKMYALHDFLLRDNNAFLQKFKAVSNRVAMDLKMNGVLATGTASVIARQIFVRALHEAFVANVRVVGCPRLPAHEKTLILLYAIENIINESRSLHELGQPFGTLIISGVRNAEWLNGTSHALCMAFAGSNSDVSLSDRISVMAQPHVNSAKKMFIGDIAGETPRGGHHAWERFTLRGHG